MSSTHKIWDLGKHQLSITQSPLVMGILNVTPDSFSDGGKHDLAADAVRVGLQMQADGADIIDVGGESTRPYAEPVEPDIERERVIPVIRQLADQLTIPISIDTSKASVAKAAIDAGAEIINDVTALEGDPAMGPLAAQANVGVCLMHMQGSPQTMQDNPEYENVVDQIYEYLVRRRSACIALGIRHERICLDPGIGFGKTHDHNLALLRATKQFAQIGSPLLVGHSRKGFIAKILGDKQADRMAGTLGVSLALAAAGADILRVHDVRETVDALQLFRASGGLS